MSGKKQKRFNAEENESFVMTTIRGGARTPQQILAGSQVQGGTMYRVLERLRVKGQVKKHKSKSGSVHYYPTVSDTTKKIAVGGAVATATQLLVEKQLLPGIEPPNNRLVAFKDELRQLLIYEGLSHKTRVLAALAFIAEFK